MKKLKINSKIKSSKKGLFITAILLAQFGFAQDKPEEFKGVIGKTLADSKEY